MLRKLLALAVLCVGLASPACAQSASVVVLPSGCGTGNPGSPSLGYLTVDTTLKLCVNASVSASITGFPTVQTTGTPIAVTTGGVTGTLPAGAVVVASNVGATNGAYCKLGASATTSDQLIPPNSWFAFTVGANTQLTCITSTSTTTVNMVGGSGLPTGSGGGGGGSGGGGAITAALNSYAAGALSAGAFAAGAGVDGWDLTQGAKADALCTVPTSATACSVISLLKALTNVANNPIAAGEAHVGEIASNQIKVQVAQTVTSGLAYASGNAIGNLMTIAGAARVSGSLGAAGTGGILTGMMMNSKSLQTTQVDVVFFDANPTGSTCTDKTAFSLATADFDKVVGYLTVPGTPANGAGWVAGTVGSVGVATYYPMTYDLASSTSLFACAITRGTPTFTATTDVSFKFNALRN